MELKITPNKIEFEKELNDLDKLVIDFTSILNKLKINYVVVSGYVAILFGRSRSSEDIDIILEKLDENRFLSFWNEVTTKLWCINTDLPKNAYYEYLLNKTSIRFSKKDDPIPNVEIKFAEDNIDVYSMQNKIQVIVNNNMIFISPIEVQIAFKFYLGSYKDIEDALHLYEIFKDKLDKNELLKWIRKLNIYETAIKYLK